MGSSHFFLDDFTVYLIGRFLIWNTNLIFDTYLSFFYIYILKNNNKKMYALLSIQILLVYSLMLELGIPYPFVWVLRDIY
jgi:hypothetical protein